MGRKHETVEVGTGDVFVDLGFADAGERRLRVQLAARVNELIAARRLTQNQTASIFDISQPHVSELKNYKLSRFTSERLLHFLTLLDRDVEILIRPKGSGHAAGSVRVLVVEGPARAIRGNTRRRQVDIVGGTGYRGPPRSTADMQRAVERGVKARRDRGRY